MARYHPLLELAPRDIVARAITREGMGAGLVNRVLSIWICAPSRASTCTALSRHQRRSGAILA